METDLTAKILQFTIDTTLNSKKIEEENNTLREQLKKNEQLLNGFDEATPRARSLQAQLKEKEEKLENKKLELIELQESIIATLRTQSTPKEQNPKEELAPIPIVLNRIQQMVMNLTETAVDQNTTSIPILSLFKASDLLNHLFDALVDQKIIEENEQEREARIKQFVLAQQQILEQLKKMLQQAEEEEMLEEEEEIEEELKETEKSPKVEEIENSPKVEEVENSPKVEEISNVEVENSSKVEEPKIKSE